MNLLMRCATFTIVALLFFTACDKLLHWSLFVATLETSPLSLGMVAPPVAGVAIATEFLVALGIAVPRTRRPGLLIGAGVFGFFAAVVLVLARVRPESACGCSFAFGGARPDGYHAALNVALALLCYLLWRSLAEQRPAAEAGGATTRPDSTTHLLH